MHLKWNCYCLEYVSQIPSHLSSTYILVINHADSHVGRLLIFLCCFLFLIFPFPPLWLKTTINFKDFINHNFLYEAFSTYFM